MTSTEDKVLDALQLMYPQTLYADDIANQLNANKNTVRGVLGRLAKSGKIEHPAPGAYRARPPQKK